jgi:hypothetical protein
MDWITQEPWFYFWQGKYICFFSTASRPAQGPQISYTIGREAVSSGKKQ